MELLELFKLISDQSNQADIDTKIRALNKSVLILDRNLGAVNSHLDKIHTWLFVLGFLVMLVFLLTLYDRWQLGKKLKKIELAAGLKNS